MLGVLALEPDAPLMVQQVALVLAAVPVLRLLPPSVRRQMDQWPHVITGLFLAERLGFLFLANTLFYRLSTVALTAVALAAILWLMRRGHKAVPVAPTRQMRALRAIAWGAAALLCASLAANLFGNRLLRAGALRGRHRHHHAAATAAGASGDLSLPAGARACAAAGATADPPVDRGRRRGLGGLRDGPLPGTAGDLRLRRRTAVLHAGRRDDLDQPGQHPGVPDLGGDRVLGRAHHPPGPARRASRR
ncbi:hypothetical protein G6F35_014412 [Rhizopus arrhizus]|nr:hypothetical protein G6F35_014412 [Rhizopus arrhizus]